MTIITHLKLTDKATASSYGKSYLVVGCTLHVNRSYDAVHPTSKPVCESLEITLVAPDKTDLRLQEWFLLHSLQSGELEYDIQDVTNTASTIKRIVTFQNAQCISYKEHYDIKKRSQCLLTLKIFPETCKVEEITFKAEKEDD